MKCGFVAWAQALLHNIILCYIINLIDGFMVKSITKILSSKNLRLVYLPWFLLAIFYFYQYTFRIYPNHLEEHVKLAFNITAASFGSIGALYLLAYSLCQIPLGLIVDRVGVKKVVLSSIILCLAGVFLFRSTNHFPIAQISRILMGLGSASAFMCALKVIADHFPPGRRGMLMGLTLTFGTISPLLTGSFITKIGESYNWKIALDLMMIFGIILFFAILFFMPKREVNIYQQNNVSTISEVFKSVSALITNRTIIAYSLLAVGLYTPLSALADVWGVSFIRQKFNISPIAAGSISDLLFLGLSVGSLFLPWYCEKRNIINKSLFICLFLLLGLFATLIYASISLKVLIVCIILIGFFSGAEMMCFTGALRISNSHNSGEIIGVVNTLNMIGSAIIQWVIGLLLDYNWDGTYQDNGLRYYSSSSYQYALTSVVFLIALCAFSYFLLKSSKLKNLISKSSIA